ncbi:FecR family protein [Prevotella sp. KH2C16]|uniref:FecR family protein n=1 Tax=Prevotella sp. KH2C16 TaxID=1855325 RepID=UPI0008EEDA12|nr:FecR domain-containing protein [Prevotella sp. KH2C16]SFF82434.1 ferric-dicitrate binding protein FerR, regulates iron transport through sigma-19 [Prevotella sp. KH2C16]
MDIRIIRYANGELPAQEKESLLRDAGADPLLRQQLMEVLNVSALAALHPAAADGNAGRESLRQFRQARTKERRLAARRSLLKYAAGFVLGLLAATAVVYFNGRDGRTTYQELSVPYGQRARITLPDGSKAWVNSGSTLRYPSAFGSKRLVELRGEGLFEVAKDHRHPFILSSKGVLVRALGTRFNVYGYDSRPLTVSLLEGAVKVYPRAREREGVVLLPGQQVVADGRGLTVSPINQDVSSWQDGVLSFHATEMGDIVQKLQLYYGVKITAASPDILTKSYTGKFRQQDGLVEILRLISKVHHFKISWNEKKNEIILYH